jgi:cytochrome bd-type quinol oxidase subunit 1
VMNNISINEYTVTNNATWLRVSIRMLVICRPVCFGAVGGGVGRQAVYVYTEARLSKHCYSRKAISIIYFKRVFVALNIQHVMLMRHFVICGMPRSKICFHIIS